MVIRPDISDNTIISRLRDWFGLCVCRVAFLPIGDVDSALYRVATEDGTPYFLKLRRGAFNEVAVALTTYLKERGIEPVMAPIVTAAGEPLVWADGFAWMLYPFLEGRSGFEAAMSRAQWVTLGAAVRAVHATQLPPELAGRVPREDFAPRWRNMAAEYDRQMEQRASDDAISASFAAFWATERAEIHRLIERSEKLAQVARERAGALVLCHTDLHGGNVLVGANGEIAIVDWDEPLLAPKERDLMFVGGGIGGVGRQTREAGWFYAGYGPTFVDPVLLAYFRHERIVIDVATYAEQVLDKRRSAEDRERGLRKLSRGFLPGNVVEIAHESYPWVE